MGGDEGLQLIELLNMIILTFIQVLFNPIFWVVVFLVGLQYRRIAANRVKIFGGEREPIWRPTLVATLYGLLGGMIGSIIMVFLGISLSGVGIGNLWLVAIVLMLVAPRFICFAYAGGLISLSYLLLGFPQVNVPELMGLVAILHMVESILILVSGHLGAVPIFTKDEGGRLVGGFTLQKLWPIPIVVLFAATAPEVFASSSVEMPDWWPLIKSSLTEINPNTIYTMIPVVAGLGYGDLALARRPEEKSRLSAMYLGTYSIILLLLAILASKYFFPFAFLAALFSPLGHELVISIGQKLELKGKAYYVPPERGVMLLDVNLNSPAGKIGLESGDIILNVNGYPVYNKHQLEYALQLAFGPTELEYLKGGKRMVRELVSLKYNEAFGVIPVPEGNEEHYVELRGLGPLGNILKRFFAKLRQ